MTSLHPLYTISMPSLCHLDTISTPSLYHLYAISVAGGAPTDAVHKHCADPPQGVTGKTMERWGWLGETCGLDGGDHNRYPGFADHAKANNYYPPGWQGCKSSKVVQNNNWSERNFDIVFGPFPLTVPFGPSRVL